jgi:hypothetical protein
MGAGVRERVELQRQGQLSVNPEATNMKNQTIRRCLFAVTLALVSYVPLQAANIEPPKVQLVDKFGVNVANGQVTHSMQLVSIGGAMGLSDGISVYANDFNFVGGRGFHHSYYAQARDVALDNGQSQVLTPRNIMRVYDPSASADFAYYVNGVLQNTGTATSGYTFVPVGDERNILEESGNDLLWTKPDGTVVTFTRAPISPHHANDGGTLSKIEYPGGFTVTVSSAGMSVATNTGFQLRQLFQSDSTGCSASPPVRTSDESGWTTANPKSVVAINASLEYCSPTGACTPASYWPKATFDWPHCMPDIMFRQDNQMNVTNAQGIATTYKFKRYDLAYAADGHVVTGYTPGQQYSARLTGVSAPNNSAVIQINYSFKNLFSLAEDPSGFYTGGGVDYRLQTAGVVTAASRGSEVAGYEIFRTYMGGPDSENVGRQGAGVFYVRLLGLINGGSGVVDYADTDEGRVFFEHSPRNFPASFTKSSAPNETYGYTRGNLTSISYSTSQSSGFSSIAEYPTTCTPGTRKTCNQATRIRDPNGNWTDYEYHPQSGQVSKITSPPANSSTGVRPQTRYEYKQIKAHYYDATGAFIAGPPIWMKVAERYCINSAALLAGGCTNNDEVVTRYIYNNNNNDTENLGNTNNNNLLPIGMSVTDPSGAVHLTCYRYDKYGNQIGVTTPNASLGSCP